MPTYWPSIPDDIQTWIRKQPVFFTATAPTYGKHINVSPKGYPSRSFAIMSPNCVAYVDSTGSGIETISHIYENGRATVMFCSFTKFCRILRLFCHGRVIERSSPEFKPYIRRMQEKGMRVENADPKVVNAINEKGGQDENLDVEGEGNGVLGARAIVVLDVWKVQHSCGYGVPLLMANLQTGELEENIEEKIENGPDVRTGSNAKRTEDPNNQHSTKFDEHWDDRNTMYQWNVNTVKKGGMKAYRIKNNYSSLDDVPGLSFAIRDAGRNPTMVRLEHRIRRVFVGQGDALCVGVLLGLFLALVLQRLAIRAF